MDLKNERLKNTVRRLEANNKLKNLYKSLTSDNYEKNRAKVKSEIIKPNKNTPRKEKPKVEELPQASDFPKQINIKLLSAEGEELKSEMTIPIQTTVLDLNIMMNKLKKMEEVTSYVFSIKDFEIKYNLLDTLIKLKDFNSEEIISIIYRPESLFSVKPLTRASTTLEGHTDSILTVQFSPDGKHLASGGGDNTVRFWDTYTETPAYTGDQHVNWVLFLAFSPCATMLASGSVDGVFVIWDPNTGNPLSKNIKAHGKWITSLSWKPLHLDEDCKFLITTSKDGFMKIWNVKTQTCVLSVSAHSDSITKAIWGGDNYIYTCSQDKLIKVWDESGGIVQVLRTHAHWINTMTINTEFVLRTSCFDDKKVNFNDNRTDMCEYAKKRYNKVKENSTTEKIVSGSDDFTLILWDPLKSDKPVCRMTGHQGLVNQVMFSPDTFYIASASFDKSIKIWNGHTGAFLFNFRGHVGPVYQLAWSPDSRLILSGSKDSTLKCWNVKVKRLMYELPGHADEVYCVDWSPDGEKAVSGSKDRRIRIWKN